MRRTLGLLALAALLASACTVSADVPDNADRTPDPAASPGGTIRVGITVPKSIDPSLVTPRDPAGWLVVSVLCDTPIAFDPITGELRPAIARRFQSTESGRLVTATLREDVKMHNGANVGALDITYAMSRAAQPETVSPSAEVLSDIGLYDRLRSGEADDDILPGARPVGPLDLELVMVPAQRGEMMRVLGHPVSAPMPRRTLLDARNDDTDDEYGRQPVCAGPYRLAAPWQPGEQEIRLVRFEDYYGANAAFTRGGAGYADEIVFRTYPDRAAMLAGYAAGEVDIAHVDPGQRAEAASLPGTLVDTPTLRLDYVGLPTSKAPFTDPSLRRLLSMVLDRERLSREVFDGGREPATGILSPALGEDLYRDVACGPNAPASGLPAEARDAMSAARDVFSELTVPFYFNDEFGHRELVEAIAEQWRETLGLQVELRPMEWEAYMQVARSPEGFDGPFRMSHTPEYPSADEVIRPLFDSAAIGSTNMTRFADNRFDRRVERQARRATTLEDQALEYQELENAICGQMPLIPVVFGATHYLFNTDRIGSAVGTLTARTSSQPVLRELYVR